MKLSSALQIAFQKGFKNQFVRTKHGSICIDANMHTNYFESGYECIMTLECKEDNVILYLIRTLDSIKGYLLDILRPSSQAYFVAFNTNPVELNVYVLSETKGTTMISIHDIYYFAGTGNGGTEIHCVENGIFRKYTTTKTLSEIEASIRLPFLRVHRSYIISVRRVKQCIKERNGSGTIIFDNPNVGKAYFSKSYRHKLVELQFLK